MIDASRCLNNFMFSFISFIIFNLTQERETTSKIVILLIQIWELLSYNLK
jgi:hypothetical protein